MTMRATTLKYLGACVLTMATTAGAAEEARDRAVTKLLETAGVAANVSNGRELFEQVVATEAFSHGAIGPFDIYVYRADGLESERTAARVVKDAIAGLEPLVPVMERYFSRDAGVISGRRFPIVITEAGKGESSFDEALALVDRCEDEGFSEWKPINPFWTTANRAAEVARTWEVQVFNLAHATIADRRKDWFSHGLGYYTAAHIANRLLRRGAWGNVPPWLAQGLIDELDIQAYGEAWVGGEWFQHQTPGWSRPGWSGFVPKGSRPPMPVRGPPADLAVTVRKTGDSWSRRSNSGQRHWKDLVTDRKSEAPASFAFMAEHESFLPRDRAYARCVMHMLLAMIPEGDMSLLTLLDEGKMGTPRHGMPDADPLTTVFANSLGRIPAVEDAAALPLGEVLEMIGRTDIADSLTALGAKDALRVTDHRSQSIWLYGRSQFNAADRGAIFNLFLEAEYYEQLHHWKLIGEVLDEATAAALDSVKRYPKRSRDQEAVVATFQGVLVEG